MDGKLVGRVDVSWTAKPCGRSSRSMMLRCPPELGAWAWAGAAATSQADPKTSHRAAGTLKLVIVFLLFTPVSRDRAHVRGRESSDCRGKIPWHRRIYANGGTLSTLLRLRYAMRQPLRARVMPRGRAGHGLGSEGRRQLEDANPRRDPQSSDLLQHRVD